MAGLPSHPKKSSKSGSGRSTKQTIGKEPTVGQEELESVGRSRSRPKGRSNAASNLQQQEGASEGSAPWKRESSVQSSSSGSGSDLLWITADKPAVFKDANIKKLISRHVMRDFQSKDQSGKDPSQAPKMKKMAIRPSSSESTLQRVTSHPSQIVSTNSSRGFSFYVALGSSALIIVGYRKRSPNLNSINSFTRF